jgi:hypothetical protein
MKLEEALKTNKPIKRPNHINAIVQYFDAGTGPYCDLVGCSYFVVCDDGDNDWYFVTSLDLYPEDIFADNWEVVE